MIEIPNDIPHRCIRGTAWILNPEEGQAWIKIPVRVGDHEPEENDWSWGFNFCPECGKPVEAPNDAKLWMIPDESKFWGTEVEDDDT